MNPIILFGIISLIVGGGCAVIVHLTGQLTASTPAPPRLDAYDLDAVHRADLISRFAVKP